MNLMHLRATVLSYVLLSQAISDGIDLKWENNVWTIYNLIMEELLALLQKKSLVFSHKFFQKIFLIHKIQIIIFLMIFQYDF